MRINSSTLRYMWAYHKASHEGVLTHKSPKDSSPSAKHFRLISNLLFYELRPGGTKKDGPDIGVMLMEKCVVERVGAAGQPSRMFSVMFDGEDWAKHNFTASTPEQCTIWINALSVVSYQHLRAQISKLQASFAKSVNPVSFERLQGNVLKKMGHKGVTTGGSSDSLEKRLERPPVKPKTKIKHKSKLGSTFYGADESNEPGRGTMPRPQSVPNTDMQSHSSKSKFFAQLDVVKAPSKSLTLGMSSRAVSSTVDELRKKAMTIDRKPVGSTTSIRNDNDSGFPIQRSSIAPRQTQAYPTPNGPSTLSADLLQFASSPAFHVNPPFISCNADQSKTFLNAPHAPVPTAMAQVPSYTAPNPSQSGAIHDLIGLDFNI